MWCLRRDHLVEQRLAGAVAAEVLGEQVGAAGEASVPALREVDLEITEGELCLLVGPSGVGKSTLLGTVSGLVPHFTGVSDPYEPPLNPEVVCYSDGRETPEQSAAKVIAKLETLGYIERRAPVAFKLRPPKLKARWVRSNGKGTLLLRGSVGQPARLRIELRRPGGGPSAGS